jgi:hypothetical protein
MLGAILIDDSCPIETPMVREVETCASLPPGSIAIAGTAEEVATLAAYLLGPQITYTTRGLYSHRRGICLLEMEIPLANIVLFQVCSEFYRCDVSNISFRPQFTLQRCHGAYPLDY